jgi:type I restriction-modification system DNA methylase subunit
MSEAGVHFDFYRHLQNTIDDTPQRGARTYERIVPEYSQDIDGRADLVVFDTDEPVLVIEAKRPDGDSGRDIDPYSPIVIRQAHGYASELGTPFFATYNGERLVLFNTHEEGVPLLKRSTKSYDIGNVEAFASTLLDEIDRLEAGRTQWDSLDDAFIERVRSLHEQLTPELRAALTEQLDRAEFRESFVEWAGAQGIEYGDMAEDRQQEVRERFAEEGAYLLVNKLIFYKILESARAYSGEVRPLAIRENHARADLETYFEEVVTNVDFEAVFEHDTIYSEIPLTRVGQRISEFIGELDSQDLTQFDTDVIGRIYEGVIPPDRRHDMGEYYTPPAITNLITRLTIDDANETVLDPACGSGGFLVSTYHRKQGLLPVEQGSHERILDHIYGIDINRFPAHLSAINLAIQELSAYTENVHIEVRDFFDVAPDTMRFSREQASPSGSDTESGMINEGVGGFDVVIGNPPYIRYQNIGDRDRIRSHLNTVDAEYLSGFSDIYCYFITHSTQFLSENGRLGFIVSDRWLDTQYGEDLQQFLLENYKIRAVIRFDTQAFDDALVGSSVIIAEKCDNPTDRMEKMVKFLQVREQIGVDKVASLVEQEIDTDELIISEDYRLLATTQGALSDIKKWNLLYSAPPIYFDVIRCSGVTELQDVADLHTGKKVGGNPFFYKRKEEWEELGLQQYTSPAIKASGQVNKIRFDDVTAEEWEVLDVLDLVQKALSDDHSFGDSKLTHTKNWLGQNDHKSLLEYVNWGEDEEYHKHDRCERRDVWFCIDDIKQYRPSLVIPQFLWRANRVLWNDAEAFVDWQFHVLNPHNDTDNKLLCGILNSRVVWLARELEGRQAGGAGMTRSELRLYEAKQLSIPDPRQMTEDQQREIVEAVENLIEVEDQVGGELTLEMIEDERDELDNAVLSAIGLEERLGEVKQAVQTLLEIRERGAGKETQVLIERESAEPEVIELEGVSMARESATLDDF